LKRLALATAVAALLAACADSADSGPDCSPEGPGGWLAFTSTRTGNYDVWLVRPDGGCLRQATSDAAADLFPAWTPDGKLAFSSTRTSGAGVYVYDLASGQVFGIPVLNVTPTAPDFSRAGPWMAFESRAGGTRSDVYAVLASGGTATALTTGPGNSAGATWSPDGATLYFVSSRTGAFLVYSMDSSGGNQVALPGTAGVLGRPALSPDGTTLAYARMGSGGVAEVVAYQLPTGPPRVVTSQGDSDPAFCPTGARLAVSSSRGGTPAIWMVNVADGGNAAADGQPAFRP
jgi:TolB protein